MDGRHVGEEMERKIWAWAAALMPLLIDVMKAVMGWFRRLMLALFGGLPAEASGTQPRQTSTIEAGTAELDPDEVPTPGNTPTLKPRWRERVVRECLRRISEGHPLRDRHLLQLPSDVREWLLELRPESAEEIKHLPDTLLRREHELWRLGGEMIGGPQLPAPMEEHATPEPRRGFKR